MSEEIDETYRENLRRENARGAGDFWIKGGIALALLAIVSTVVTASMGASAGMGLMAVPVALLAVIVGYLKKIAAALQVNL